MATPIYSLATGGRNPRVLHKLSHDSLVFLLILQADRGLYKDTACTIPATVAGDIIKGWKDEMTGSGMIAIQATDSKAPTLQFEGGVPVVEWDGVDDEMRISAAIPAPYTVTAVVKLLDIGLYPMVISSNCELRWHSNEGKAEIAGIAVASTQPGSSLNSWIVSQGVLGAANEEHFQDGVSAGVSTADAPITSSASGIQIGNREGAGFFLKGRMTHVSISNNRPSHTTFAGLTPA